MAMMFPTFDGKRVSMQQIEARQTFQFLHPTMQQRVKDLMLASEGKVGLGEGFRSTEVAEGAVPVPLRPGPQRVDVLRRSAVAEEGPQAGDGRASGPVDARAGPGCGHDR